MTTYIVGGLFRENNVTTIAFTRPEAVSDIASGQLHIGLANGVVMYPLVNDEFVIPSSVTENVGQFFASVKWIDVDGKIKAEENFILEIQSRVDGDAAAIIENPDVIEDHEIRILALEQGGAGNLVLGETSTTAYRGDRGKIAYDHSQTAHAPADAEKNVNADWNAVSGDAVILNKPTAGTNIDFTGNAVSVVDVPSFGAVHFDTVTPAVVSSAGDVAWNAVDGTLDIHLLNGATLQTGQELHFYGKAVGAISNGDLCQFAGVQGDHILMKKAVASEVKANPHYLIGIATQNIADAAMGYVTWFGKVNGVYTTGWVAGDILYFDNATGQLTKTMPVAPATKIIVASVVKAATGGSENGVLLVRPTFSLNLNELDDVYHNGIQDGYSLIWNGSTLRWEAQKKIDTSAYSSAWNGSAYVPTQDAIFDKIETLVPVFYNPATMTVNAGTLNQGTVADLSAVGGTDVIIQELSGANPLTATFTFANVARLSSVQMYLDYVGGASHVINCEIYNVGTTAWDILGSFSTTSGKVWRSFQIFNPNSYVNAGAVSLRFRHVTSGVNTHQLIIDYLDINSGGSGGTGYVGATSVGFTPTGGISATNVQAALAEVDAEKAPAAQGVTNGDTHDHSGGDGAQIAYSSLSGTPTSMTPTAHKTTHATGGSDALTAGDIGAQATISATTHLDYMNSASKEKTVTGSTLDFSDCTKIIRAVSGSTAVSFTTPTFATPASGTKASAVMLVIDYQAGATAALTFAGVTWFGDNPTFTAGKKTLVIFEQISDFIAASAVTQV